MSHTHTATLTWDEPQTIAEALKAGKIGLLLVDTIYGLVGTCQNASRIERIKGRGADHPFIWLLPAEDFDRYSRYPVPEALKVGVPGGITLVTELRDEVGAKGSTKDNSQAIRAPRGTAETMLKALGEPLISTSANISGMPYVGDIDRLRELFEAQVDFIVVGGPKEAPEGSHEPSTIVDIRNCPYTILREGAVKLS